MMDARRAGIVGIAFLVGLLLGAAVFYEGSPLGGLAGGLAGAPVQVRVNNVGTHAAEMTIQVAKALGPTLDRNVLTIDAGGTHIGSLPRQDAGQLIVTVTATWEDSSAGTIRRGENRVGADAGDCGAGETLVFTFDVDTTRGVAFPRAFSTCL